MWFGNLCAHARTIAFCVTLAIGLQIYNVIEVNNQIKTVNNKLAEAEKMVEMIKQQEVRIDALALHTRGYLMLSQGKLNFTISMPSFLTTMPFITIC